MVPLVDDPARAQRMARAVLSDIACYQREKVHAGLAADDLFERLDKEIQAAREWFAERVTPELSRGAGIFERALVDVLVYRNRSVDTPIW